MSTTGSVTGFMGDLAMGNRREEAARELVDRYFKQIACYASRWLTLRGVPQCLEDGEHAALIALAKVLRGLEGGRLQLAGRDDLRRVLQWSARCVIINGLGGPPVEHVGDQAPWDGDRREGDQGPRVYRKVDWSKHTLYSPDALLEAEEECRRLLDLLDVDLRQIALLKLANLTNKQIAKKLDCSLAKVERKLTLIRSKWADFETVKVGPRKAREVSGDEISRDIGGTTTMMSDLKGLR